MHVELRRAHLVSRAATPLRLLIIILRNGIATIPRYADAGAKINDVCRRYGISSATYYNWKSKYGGMDADQLKRLKELESEVGQYKRMYAELAHENYALKELIDKKL